MPESIQAKPELKTEAILAEGPVWDEDKHLLWWVDIMSGLLNRYNPATQENVVFDLGEHVGAAALRKNGGLVLVLKSGFYLFNEKTGEKKFIADPEAHLSGNRFNDGKCDPAGRFWAGTMSYNIDKGAGSLYCLNPDFEIDTKLRDITISNGLAWNSKGDRFFFIDTPTGNIFSFQYEQASGKISGKTTIFHVDEKAGVPDGMTIDTENKLWIALYGGGKVIRVNPESGTIEFEVHLPVPKITSCTFGGEKMNELYITTCREHMAREELAEYPLSGSLFKAELPFRGLPAHRFSG